MNGALSGWAAGLLALGCVTAAAQSPQMGRDLYERGVHHGPTGTVELVARQATVGSVVLRGAAVACANCHGVHGQPVGEAQGAAASLRWPQWSSTQPSVLAEARARFERALRHGLGPNGRVLSAAMPRFELSEEALQSLIGHVSSLVMQPVSAPVPTLAMLVLDDGQAPAIEREVHERLQRCLHDRLGARAEVQVRRASDAAQAQRLWAAWAEDRQVVAALAPPWRGWQPPTAGAGAFELPVLFPLVADPLEPARPGTQWLFGGTWARALALVLAWQQQAPPTSAALAVWAAPQAGGAPTESLQRLAEWVWRLSGRPLSWTWLLRPEPPPGQAALWWAPGLPPSPGWWLVPSAGRPQLTAGARWWMAQPYAGRDPQPLAVRWAAATCLTVEAVLSQGGVQRREQWLERLERLGRLGDATGWQWRVRRDDPAGLGAAEGWTVVEFQPARAPKIVLPRIDLESAGPDPMAPAVGAR